MAFRLTSHFITLSFSAVISSVLAYIAWQRRTKTLNSASFILLMLAVTGYSAVAALESGVTSLGNKIFWSKLEYVGSGSVITLFLIFAIQFTKQRFRLTLKNIFLLSLLPIFNAILVITNEWHQLVWTNYLLGPIGSNQIIYQHGPGFYWIMTCVYLYVLTAAWLLAKTALFASILHRQQSAMMLIGAAIPLVGGSAYMLGVTPPGLNITPMSFTLTGLVYLVNLFQFRMLDLGPIARDSLIENMQDGLLVLDKQNRIVDINPAAQYLLKSTKNYIGKTITEAFEEWIGFIDCFQKEAWKKVIVDPVSSRYLEVQTSLLYDHRKRIAGRLLIFRDITQRHVAELELRQANERLRQQLIEIEILQNRLQEQAIRDSLTHLFNRRYFEETFTREMTRAHRESYPIALILLDLDYFKRINDTYGHRAGDRVLQVFADCLRHHTRSSDIACRYGGEEFVIALPGMALQAAYQRAEAIRRDFQETSVQVDDQTIYTTVSIGLGNFPDHGQTHQELMHRIDQALYIAKANGRNQVQIAE